MTTPWADPACPRDDRVEALLAEMTLEEKLAQLGSAWPGVERVSGNVAPMQDVFARHTDFSQARKDGLGHLTRPFGTKPVDPSEGARHLASLQRELMDSTRLGLPAIAHEECLTGFTTHHASVFPTALAWAATFNPGLVERMAHAIGTSMRQVGVHQGLSPFSTSYATTAGAASRRPSARTPTWSPPPAPPTSAVWRAPGSSPPSSTSPTTQPRRPPATTRPSPWARGSSPT